MPRSATVVLLLLPLLFALPILAQDETREAQKKKHAEALKAFEAATEAYDEIHREIKHDFDLIRGEHWPKIAERFELAIEEEVDYLREDAEYDLVDGVTEQFFDISAICDVTYNRLVKAIEGPIREAAKSEDPIDSVNILKAGLKVVFPEEKFDDNWNKHFTNLPQVAAFDKAEAALDKAETALAAPIMPPLPESDGPKGMVYVKKGRFTYGPWTGWEFDLKKNKASKARAKAFYIDAFEVTNGDYLKFLEKQKDEDRLKQYMPKDFKQKADGTIRIPRGSKYHPVTGITFAAAEAYARSVGKRLPTEEEWEYAARGAEGLLYPWGAEFKKNFANSRERGLGKQNVGSHPKDKSPCGAYDMAGNASEMTVYIEGRKALRVTPKPTDNIITRGGCFDEDTDSLKATHRWTLRAIDGTSKSVGFRCVISASKK